MSLGAGIFLLVVGAILAFAVDVQSSFVDLQLVGYILMFAGAVGIVLGIAFMFKKRRSITTHRDVVDPVSGERVSATEQSIR